MNGYCHGLDFESKKGRSEGSKRHTSSDCVPMQTGYLKRTESVQVPILDDPVQKVEEIKLPSVNFEELSLPQPSELSQKRNFSESNNLFDLDPNRRLGSGDAGSDDIKRHPYFEGIDWELMRMHAYQPLAIPMVTSPFDTSNYPEYQRPEYEPMTEEMRSVVFENY